ncbi:hypothetical protein Efla_000060 [Eimeria flavescens]
MASFQKTALLGAVVAVLLAVFLDPDVTTERMKLVRPADEDGTIQEGPSFERLTFSVSVEGSKVHCWLFTPKKPLTANSPPPVIVAAYGLGVQKDIALLSFAESLAGEGFAVVLFDYRHWGVSEGLPRHLAEPEKEVADLQAVLKHIHESKGFRGKVDANRIGLYGSSLGGGVVLAAASGLNKQNNPLKHKIKALIAAVPFVSGEKTQADSLKRRGYLEALRIAGAVIRDWICKLFTIEAAVYVQLAKRATESGLSVMSLPSREYTTWASRTPLAGKKVDGAWENKLAARSLKNMIGFNVDSLVVEYLDTPGLVIAGSLDPVCPIEYIRAMVAQHASRQDRKKLTLMEFPFGHFEFITEEHFPELVKSTASYFKEQLL